MKRSRIILLSLLLLAIVAMMPTRAFSQKTTTDVAQVIPPIVTSGPTAVAACTVLQLLPGSLVSGTSGFIMATCPTTLYAITFRATTLETPTFIQTGWVTVSIIEVGNDCSFNFRPVSMFGTHLIGANLTSTVPVTFSASPSNTTLTAGGGMGFNYCLYYSNPLPNGIATFGIAWSP